MNLCTNAGYAMKEFGGKLTVTLKEVKVNGVFAALHGIEPGSYVKLSITDTGQGIDPKILPRIFDPFFTTKPMGEGTGMGLAVVHGIVTAHGGAVEVSSELKHGTTFDIYLPCSAKPVEPKQEVEAVIPHGSGRVLVVDDDVSYLDLLADMLESLGYQAEKKTSSLEALEMFRTEPDRFDLVIVDQIMPKIGGSKLASEILRIRPKLPILLCTGSYAAALRDAKAAGVRRCLEKPVSINELARAVKEVLVQV